jgi:hypothetical protein
MRTATTLPDKVQSGWGSGPTLVGEEKSNNESPCYKWLVEGKIYSAVVCPASGKHALFAHVAVKLSQLLSHLHPQQWHHAGPEAPLLSDGRNNAIPNTVYAMHTQAHPALLLLLPPLPVQAKLVCQGSSKQCCHHQEALRDCRQKLGIHL